MAQFARIDSQIRANRLILVNCFSVPELNPLFCESRCGGLQIANRRSKAIRANRSHIVKIGVFLRIDSRESIHTNRPDSRCESPGHLSSGEPNPKYFSKSTAVQMGGVLPYKWEAYCSTNVSRIAGLPFLRSLEARKVRRYKWGGRIAVQIGGVLPYFLDKL